MASKAETEFVDHVKILVRYWDSENLPDMPVSRRDRLEGLSHSFLVLLDGFSAGCDLDTVVAAFNGDCLLHDLLWKEAPTKFHCKICGHMQSKHSRHGPCFEVGCNCNRWVMGE